MAEECEDICDPAEVKRSMKAVVKTMECPICLDYLDSPYRTACFHQFCKACIGTVLSSKSPRCPLCKEKITKRGMCESVKLAKIVETVKELERSVAADTGLPDTPSFIPSGSYIGASRGKTVPITIPTPIKPKLPLKRKREC